MASLSAYYPLPVVAGTTAGTYAEGNAPRIIDVTHAELLTLIGSQNLKTGFHYRITDFVTEYISNDNEWISPSNTANVSNNNGTAFTVASIAATPEPLIVYAYSSSNVSRNAYSNLHPQDIIHYDPSLIFLDGTNTAKGFITYRKDTFNNIETDYDWKNIKFKRWVLNPSTGSRQIPSYASSTSYNIGNFVTDNNLLYICVKDHVSSSVISANNFINCGSYTISGNGLILHELGLFEFGARKTVDDVSTLFGGGGQAGYYHTFCNSNGSINTTNRFKNVLIQSSKPPVQNPNFSNNLPNIVLSLNLGNNIFYRNIQIKNCSSLTMFGSGSKTNINIEKSVFLYVSSTLTDLSIDDCSNSYFAGILNGSNYKNCSRSFFPSSFSFGINDSTRISVNINQQNKSSFNCYNSVISGSGTHLQVGLTERLPISTDTYLGQSQINYPSKNNITFTNGASNLPVAIYADQNNTNKIVPFFKDEDLLFKHVNSELLDLIDGVNPSGALAVFSTKDNTTPSYTRNTSFWLDSLKSQLTCVSPWNSTYSNLRAGVAITKRHIQFARHFPLAAASTIRFITSDNQVVDRNISRVLLQTGASGNDIGIGLLNEDLPESISVAKVFSANQRYYLPSEGNNSSISTRRSWMPSSGVFYIDQDENANIVDWIGYGNGQFLLNKPLSVSDFYNSSNDANKHEFFNPIITNDSGSSVFAIINGECVLLGCLWQGNDSPNEGELAGICVGETGEDVLNGLISSIDAAEGISTGYTITTPNLSSFSEVS